MIGGADAGSRRRRILPAILVPALLLALTGGLVAVDRSPSEDPGGAASRYVPEDGDSARYRMQDGAVRAVEHARVIGVQGALTGPDAVASAVIGVLGEDGVQRARFWREVTTTPDRQFEDLYVLGDDGVRQIASWGGAVGFTFEPGLLILPRDVSPGAEWTSSGSALANGALTYDSAFRASAADQPLEGADGESYTPPEGCLQVEGSLTLEQPGVGALLESTDTSVWCPRLGRVFSSGTQNGEAFASVLVPDSTPLPPPPDVPSPEAGEDGARDARAALETLDAVVVDEFFGESVRQGSITSRPAVTTDGMIVTANEHGDDVLAWRLEDPRAVLAWTAHPGGTIAAVSVVGDTVFAATEDRAVRAYDARGRRLWSWAGDDLVLAPVVGVPGTGDVVVGTRGGTIARLSGENGQERWSVSLGADLRRRVVVAGDTVVVADERGRISGLDAATGERRWRSEYGMAADLAGAPPGSHPLAYLLTEEGDVLAIELDRGNTVWEEAIPGLPRFLSAAESGVVAATDEQTAWFAEDGSTVWTRGGAQEALAASDDRVVSLSGDTVVLTDADGRTIADWSLPERADPADPHLLLTGGEAVVVGPGLQLWRVGLG